MALPQVVLQDVKKLLQGGSLGCKKLLKFTCLTIKFHDRHHTNAHFSDSLQESNWVSYKIWYIIMPNLISMYNLGIWLYQIVPYTFFRNKVLA